MSTEAETSAPHTTAEPTPALPHHRETRLLRFYDRVRERTRSYLESKGGRLGARTAEALLLVPDVLLLLVRLFVDRTTPKSSRALIGGALAYFLLPADLAPEIVLGPVGWIDDLVIASTVLAHVLGPQLEPTARLYWSGPGRALDVIRDISRSAGALLGVDMAARVERLVERRLLGGTKRDDSSFASR